MTEEQKEHAEKLREERTARMREMGKKQAEKRRGEKEIEQKALKEILALKGVDEERFQVTSP